MARYVRNTDRRKSTFWAWILGIAILGVVVWGVFEIFDDDYKEIEVGSDRVGWVEEFEPSEEVEGIAPYEDEVVLGEERADREVLPR